MARDPRQIFAGHEHEFDTAGVSGNSSGCASIEQSRPGDRAASKCTCSTDPARDAIVCSYKNYLGLRWGCVILDENSPRPALRSSTSSAQTLTDKPGSTRRGTSTPLRTRRNRPVHGTGNLAMRDPCTQWRGICLMLTRRSTQKRNLVPSHLSCIGSTPWKPLRDAGLSGPGHTPHRPLPPLNTEAPS